MGNIDDAVSITVAVLIVLTGKCVMFCDSFSDSWRVRSRVRSGEEVGEELGSVEQACTTSLSYRSVSVSFL